MKRAIKLTLSAVLAVAALTNEISAAETIKSSSDSQDKIGRGSITEHHLADNSDDLFKLEEDAMIIEAPTSASKDLSFFDDS